MTTTLTASTHATFVLPPSVVTKADLSRIVTELEWVDNELTAYSIRTQSGMAVSVPTLSAALNDFLVQNKLQLGETKVRATIVAQLRVLKNKAPVINMTFAVSADRESLETLATWLRTEIHPHALIAVGLQPALVAGVYLRTPNHVRDYSLRALLENSHGVLTTELETLRAGVKPQ